MNASHRGARRLLAAAITVVAGLALAGQANAAGLKWADCGDAGAQCSTANSRDYDMPERREVRHRGREVAGDRAGQRIGSLFFNFGGPGASAAAYVEAYGADLFPVLNERFDIVGVDPRGTGDSVPVDCKANQETAGRLLAAVHHAEQPQHARAVAKDQQLHQPLHPAQRRDPAVPVDGVRRRATSTRSARPSATRR